MAGAGYMAAAVALGAILAWQPLMNAILSRAIGSPWGATAVSIMVSWLAAMAMALAFGHGTMTRATLATVPWWVYLAGLIGTAFVGGAVVIAPVTGGLLFFACVIAGQLAGATLADHFGFFGLAVRPVSLARALGIALVLGGALLAQRG